MIRGNEGLAKTLNFDKMVAKWFKKSKLLFIILFLITWQIYVSKKWMHKFQMERCYLFGEIHLTDSEYNILRKMSLKFVSRLY